MLQEGMNYGLTPKELLPDQNKYIFRFDFDLVTDVLKTKPTTPEQLTEDFNEYAEQKGIPLKIVKVIEFEGPGGLPIIKVETTKPMTPKQFMDMHAENFDGDVDFVEDGFEVAKICS